MQIQYKQSLIDKKFGFDAEKQQWYSGRHPVDPDEPQIFLIRLFKSYNVSDAGLKAESALSDAETSPELTFARFKKQHLRRDHSARARGLDVFLAWAKTVGIVIDVEDLALWCRRHPFILHRFYEAAASAGIHIKKAARIFGHTGVFQHVFIGVKLVLERRSTSRRSLPAHPADTRRLTIPDTHPVFPVLFPRPPPAG